MQYNYEEVDISLPENKVWFDKYKFDIPVVHLNGRMLMKHRIHRGLLERSLADFDKKMTISEKE